MTALKPLTQSSQNSLNNNVSKYEDKSKFKRQSPIKESHRASKFTVYTGQDKTSDTTIQMDVTQTAVKSPITSTPRFKGFVDNDETIQLDRSTTISGQITQSFVEKSEFIDKVDTLLALSKKRLGEEEYDPSKTFLDDQTLTNEFDLINSHKELDDTTLIKLLTDSLHKFKSNLNYHKLENQILLQNNEELNTRTEVENKLMKKELEKLKFAYESNKDGSKYQKLKTLVKFSIDNMDKLIARNYEASKRALKYKVKYVSVKELLNEKEAIITSLKKCQKTSPPRFKLNHQYDYQHQFNLHQEQSKAKNDGANDTTISPDHTILANSPTRSVSSASSALSSNSVPTNSSTQSARQESSRVLPPLAPKESSSPANSIESNAYNTLNMLASQALLVSTYERGTKARKLSQDLSPSATSYLNYSDNEYKRKTPGKNSETIKATTLPSIDNSNSKFKPGVAKLPSIDHLLTRTADVSKTNHGDYKMLNSDTETVNLNSNDTIDEDPTL